MTTSALRWFKAAVLLQILLLAYYVTIEVADLFPWNDLAARPGDFDLARSIALNALPQLALMALFALGVRALAIVSSLGYALYLGVQLWTGWKPVFVPGAGGEAPYGALYARTLRAVPAEWLRLAPDAQHLTLQALTLAAIFAMIMASARMRYL